VRQCNCSDESIHFVDRPAHRFSYFQDREDRYVVML
jgi:hypothetical protein